MVLQPPRWTEVTASEHAHEREGLRLMRDLLPDTEPYRAWTNFEFIADDGSINEVDALVATPKGVFVVELKHWSGEIGGDMSTWQRRSGASGRASFVDNPLLLTNRKAKKLATLLERPYRDLHERRPFLDAMVFLSNPAVVCRLAGTARTRIHTTDDIEAALTRTGPDSAARPRFVAADARHLTRAMEAIGVRPSRRHRRVGDYELGPQIGAGTTFQEFAATHVGVGTRHRVRIHTVAPDAPERTRRLVEQAARREVQVLQGISHEGIERPQTITETDAGPAVVYEDDDATQRLDLFLNERRDSLTVADRLVLVRRLAEALRYAHAKGLTHRSLNPASIVVCDVDSDGAQYLQVRNWQTGHRAGAGVGAVTESGTRLTAHFADLVDATAQCYAAPDLGQSDPDWVAVDVFGLGACAFEILSGEAPASSFNALLKALKSGDGLRLAAVLDGVGTYVDELVWAATRPSVADRTSTVADFLAGLDVAELDLNAAAATTAATAADGATVYADPTGASPGDVLAGGYTVRGNLGSGSTAVVYLVRTPDGDDLVLKLADDPRHNERIREEGEVLARCRHANIVRYHATVEVGGLCGLLLDAAGDQTLRQRLRRDGPQHLDFLERFGADLLDALRYLEAEGIAHRDVKPDNLGVAAHSGTHALHLVLFDFSLARAPSEQLRAGTPGYLDPFLALRERWDLHAERYAAAVTLHEMAAGTLPRWGDGRSDPAVTDDPLVLDVDLFPAELREPLAEFLARGLARDTADRFGNADEMLRAWRRVFETVDTPVLPVEDDGTDVLAAALAAAQVTDPLLTLPFSTRAQNAFGRLGVDTVRDLLATPLAHVSHMRGVGQKTRREIVGAVKALAARFPDVDRAMPAPPAPAPVTADGDEPADSGWTLDVLAAELVPRARRRGSAEPEIVAHHLGLVATAGGGEWPTQAQVAAAVGKTRARVSQVVVTARERWDGLAALTALRGTVAAVLTELGGAATLEEVATEIRALGGAGDDDRVQALAAAAVRAATEVEAARAEPRWTYGRTAAGRVLLAADAAALDYATALGAAADALATADPLPGAQRVVAALGEVAVPAGFEALAPERLVRLAAAASTCAATAGSRMELYPRGLAPERALRLAAPVLLGAHELSEDDVRGRVSARYPAAAPLPPRPALDDLVAAAGIDLRWDTARAKYVARRASLSGLTSLTSPTSQRTVMTRTPRAHARADAAVRDFTARLDASRRDGGFLALVTTPRRAGAAAAAVAAHHDGVATVSIEAVLLAHMHAQCDALGGRWDAFVGADAAGPAGPHWSKLVQLVDRALPGVEADLAADAAATVLLTRPGLLARYGRVDLIERLRERCSHSGDGSIFGRWLLVADDDGGGAPRIDGTPLPLVTASQWIRVPPAWLDGTAAGGEVA